MYQKAVLKIGFILLYIWLMYSNLKTVQNGIMHQNVQQKSPMYCGNKYWNVQKNVGEQQEAKTLYYKVMYWKVLFVPGFGASWGPREAVLYCVAILWGFPL